MKDYSQTFARSANLSFNSELEPFLISQVWMRNENTNLDFRPERCYSSWYVRDGSQLFTTSQPTLPCSYPPERLTIWIKPVFWILGDRMLMYHSRNLGQIFWYHQGLNGCVCENILISQLFIGPLSPTLIIYWYVFHTDPVANNYISAWLLLCGKTWSLFGGTVFQRYPYWLGGLNTIQPTILFFDHLCSSFFHLLNWSWSQPGFLSMKFS